ncbi:succinate-semialdehyde dehydrogenase / glutarate-semialdehyde dehydrogenase [Rhodoferax sp. OV413]|uniref:NAD-dependent succinate-semialdehyde dehydrogenase n=1 Tax=Rhodoferax sp. OV413 TaxID=1855285 RepID=UPI000884AB39|nr:NAD-dependent succinate-semialdehyde dehydrogenase [Rhodoferax sp. OV413]SDP61280.1 succinate-semialdehyde dehydrogenase / glutarate-semialdehyde dehydrogenase [Rhodoferax sp. OV413]
MTTYPELQLHIDGEWLGKNGRDTMPVLNPATEEVLAQLPIASRDDLAQAVAAAARGHAVWSVMSAYDRAKILWRTAALLRERADHIAELMTLEQGKPLAESKGEVAGLSDILEWDAEEGRRTYGRIIPSRVAGQRQLVVKEPIGPVAVLTPWNYPALIPVRKISSVLAAGCSCIIKPAEETAACSMEIVRAFIDAGLPKGVLNLVYGVPADISDHLLKAPEVRGVAFTGSTAIGKQLSSLAALSLKRMVMELGGHAPVLVFDDVNVAEVATMSAMRKYRNAGQGCINPTRFYLHDSIFDEFSERYVAAVKAIRVGNGMDSESRMGPLAHERRVQAMQSCVDDALAHGGKLLCGGERPAGKGYFWTPAVLADVPNTAHVMNEEPFGPITVLNRFGDAEAVMREANGLPYGLAAYAFTKDGARANWAASTLQFGMVGINSYTLGAPGAIGSPEPPFGGYKDSGYGSEGGIEGLLAFMDTKFICQV